MVFINRKSDSRGRLICIKMCNIIEKHYNISPPPLRTGANSLVFDNNLFKKVMIVLFENTRHNKTKEYRLSLSYMNVVKGN
jgi:hypothetical protein